MKIQDKFLVGFLISGLLSILAVCVCLDSAQRAMRRSAARDIATETDAAMSRIDRMLGRNLSWVECCAAHLVQADLSSVSASPRASKPTSDSPIELPILHQGLSALARRLRLESPPESAWNANGTLHRFERIFATDRHGAVIAATDEDTDCQPQNDQGWWQKVRQTGNCVEPVTSTTGTGMDRIAFAAAMKDAAGAFAGAIVYEMRTSQIATLLEKLREDLSYDSVTLTLLDNRGEVICQALSAENDSTAGQESSPADGTRSGPFSPRTKQRQAKTQCEIAAHAVSYAHPDQQYVDWHLRSDYDPREVFRAASTFRRRTLAPALAFSLIGLTLGLFMSRSITEPIHRLADATRSISRGNLDSVVLVDSNDETRNLSECLHEMIGRLKSTIHNLEDEVGHRRDAEQQLAQINRILIETVAELERGNRELQDVAYAAAHDLKTPLRGIATVAQWLIHDHGDTLPQSVREQIDLLHTRSLRANRLVDGLQEYASSGHNLGEPKELDVGELLRAIVAESENPTHVAIEVSDCMPVVSADDVSLRKVFTHLIGNAIEHMDKPDGQIRVEWEDDGAWWRFHVSDDGPGIAPKYHAKIFQMYQTLVTRDETSTIGIGLCIVKKTVEAYGGTVCIRSQVGQGTTISFTWPKSPKVGSSLEQLVCHLPEPTAADPHHAA